MKKTFTFFFLFLLCLSLVSAIKLTEQTTTRAVTFFNQHDNDNNIACTPWTPSYNYTVEKLTFRATIVYGTATLRLMIIDNDGSGGKPSTILASGITTITDTNWNNVTLDSAYDIEASDTVYICEMGNATNVASTNDFEMHSQDLGSSSYYTINAGSSWTGTVYPIDHQVWGTNSTNASATPSEPNWTAPTPADGASNSSQQVFNASCSSGLNYYMYLDRNNPPTTAVLDNTTTGNYTSSFVYNATSTTTTTTIPQQVADFPDTDGLEDLATCYDPDIDITILYTGHHSDSAPFYTGEWYGYNSSSDTWTNMTNGLGPTGVGTMFYDESNSRCTLFIKYGANQVAYNTSEWIYNTSANTWEDITDTTDPMPDRDTKEACYSPDTNMVYFFSGDDGSNNPTTTELWGYNLTTSSWQNLTSVQTGTIPGKRMHMGFTYDRSQDLCLLFGGMDTGSTQLSSTYSLNPYNLTWKSESWSFSGASWTARSSVSTGFDEGRNLTIIANGRTGIIDASTNSKQVWECNYDNMTCIMRDNGLVGVIEAVNNPDFDDTAQAILLVGGWIDPSPADYDNSSFLYPTHSTSNNNIYYYSAACHNTTSGLTSSNTTVRNFTFLYPHTISITLNGPSNLYHMNNGTVAKPAYFTTTIAIGDVTNTTCNLQLDTGGGFWNHTSLTNVTGSGVQTFNSTTLNETSYDWRVHCSNGTYNNVSTTRTVIIDRTSPIANAGSNDQFAVDNTSAHAFNIHYSTGNRSYFYNRTMQDTYNYGYNLTWACNGTQLKSIQVINLTSTVENITGYVNHSGLAYGFYNCTLDEYYSDDHTKTVINDYDYNITSQAITYTTDTGTIISIHNTQGDIKSISTEKEDDRYTFTFTPNNNRKQWIFQVHSNEKLYDRTALWGFPGFVIGQHWIDFNTDTPLFLYGIEKIDQYTYNIIIETSDNNKEPLVFKSIGGLNTFIRNVTYTYSYSQIPRQVQNLTETDKGHTWASFSWDEYPETSKVEIWRDSDNIANITNGSTSYNDTGALTEGTAYVYTLYALNGSVKNSSITSLENQITITTEALSDIAFIITDGYDLTRLSGVNITLRDISDTSTIIHSMLTNATGIATYNGTENSYYYHVNITNYFGIQGTVVNNITESEEMTSGYAGPYTSTGIKDINGNNLSGQGNISNNGVRNYSAVLGNRSVRLQTGSNNLTLSYPQYWDNYTVEVTNSPAPSNHSINFTGLSNLYLRFVGDLSNATYAPGSCTINNSVLTFVNSFYTAAIVGNHTLECAATDNYEAISQNIEINSSGGPFNITITVDEQHLLLNFSSTTNGSITWGTGWHSNFTNLTEWNATSFDYLQASNVFPDGDLIRVQFNKQGNLSAQYYEYINDWSTSITENIAILSDLDWVIWGRVLNYGNEEVFGATIRIDYYQNSSADSDYLLTQRITQPQVGAGAPGTPLYINRDIPVWITVSADGYETQTVTGWPSVDFVNDEQTTWKLKQTDVDFTSGWSLTGKQYHLNEPSLTYTISNAGTGNFYYNTSAHQTFTKGALSSGGAAFRLWRGILPTSDYAPSENFTLSIYTLADGVYTKQASIIVTYGNADIKDATSWYNSLTDGDKKVLTPLLWILLIVFSSIVGYKLKTGTGSDTGFYAFSAGTVAIAIFYLPMWPVAAVSALTALGNSLSNTLEEG